MLLLSSIGNFTTNTSVPQPHFIAEMPKSPPLDRVSFIALFLRSRLWRGKESGEIGLDKPYRPLVHLVDLRVLRILGEQRHRHGMVEPLYRNGYVLQAKAVTGLADDSAMGHIDLVAESAPLVVGIAQFYLDKHGISIISQPSRAVNNSRYSDSQVSQKPIPFLVVGHPRPFGVHLLLVAHHPLSGVVVV